jgi:PAS domain S-box-containing protein
MKGNNKMNDKEQKTILLVEDEVLIGMAESEDLKKYGYNVIHVFNGQEAVRTVCDNKSCVDLILMDIDLGKEMDGTETAKIILKEHNLPILFLSGHMEREIVEKTENITSYGYVVKNSSITVLDASIKMAFRLYESNKNVNNQKIKIENKENELEFLEKRYRRLFETAKDGIIILNAETGMIVDVNPFLIEMLGYSKDQFIKKNIWDIGAFKNIDYSKKMFKDLQETGFVRYEDMPLETYDGDLIHVEFVSNVYVVDGEKVIQCNIRDITDRKKLETILSNNMIAKEALLQELKHRTKNSFNMITILIKFRADATESRELKNTLEELTLRVNSISTLYTLLYETDSYYNVDLKSYCNKVIESMIKLSETIKINKNIEEIVVSAKDAATIGMIIVELLSNAIKYAFNGLPNGEINIELKKLKSKIILTIDDNGIGLEKDFDIEKIKNLGLHLVDLMIKQLNGNIKFTSEKGTKIFIEIEA